MVKSGLEIRLTTTHLSHIFIESDLSSVVTDFDYYNSAVDAVLSLFITKYT